MTAGIADHTKPKPAILAVLFANVRLDKERSTNREHSLSKADKNEEAGYYSQVFGR